MPKKPEAHDTVAHWKREAAKYRPTGDAIIAIGAGTVPLDYFGVLGCAQYVAVHGVQHSENGHGRMGVGHPAAQALVRAEQRALAARTRTLLAKLDALVGESADDPPTSANGGMLLEADRADTPGRKPKTAYTIFGDDPALDIESTDG